ncbi:trissin receptor-like [Lytechinus variegatus]|uniref:trissin receptor-like n=1 Tax=Lytechinus variegatus TaxID=7654 RepID=UPI001BB10A8E|nr:trissin receptor-like [Lytechinus variegatus]
MNSTGESTSHELDVTSVTIYALLGSLGILGNGLVLVVMTTVKELRTTTNSFIVNQSIIDLVTSILLFLMFIAPPLPLPESEPVAKLICAVWNSKYIFWGMSIASTFNLILLTLERYFAVVFPVVYHVHFSNRRVPFLAALPWLVGLVFQIYWAVANQYSDGQCIIKHTSRQSQIVVGILVFLLVYVIPMVIMAFAYISIANALRQRVDRSVAASKRVQLALTAKDTLKPRQVNHRERARINVIKTLITVSVTFAICWAPNHIMYLCFNLSKGITWITGPVYDFTVYLAFFNMCINPFIYTFKYRRFREGLKTLFRLVRGSESSSSITTVQMSNDVIRI